MANATRAHTYNCPSLWPLDMPRSQLIAWAVVTSILSPITILANSALIYGLYKTQQLTTITNKFILIMNISDLCTGVFVLPLIVVMICVMDAFRSCNFEFFVQYIAFLFGYFSAFMLVCISIDRYLHVTKLNTYNQFMNTYRMKIVTVISFGFSVFIAYLPITFPSFWLQVSFSLLHLGCEVSMIFVYSLIFRKIAIHTKSFKRRRKEQGKNESSRREAKKEMSATKTIRFVIAALLVLYLPYNIFSVVWTYYKFDQKVNPPLLVDVITYWSYVVIFSNTAINAIIFCYGNSAVRRFLITKFCLADNQILPNNVNAQ